MKKTKIYHDVISEEEFTIEGLDASQEPQSDSPGDSDNDSDSEFNLGLNYQPSAFEPNIKGEGILNPDSAMIPPNDLVVKPKDEKFRIPSVDMVQSSEKPSPRVDHERPSDSN